MKTTSTPAVDGPRTENDALIEAVRETRAQAIKAEAIDDHLLLVQTTTGVEKLDLIGFADGPRRIEKDLRLHTLDALARYVTEHRLDDTRIYADITNSTFTAILDDDTVAPDQEFIVPAWRRHRAIVTLRRHPLFEHWLSGANKLHPQQEFIERLDAGRAAVLYPDAATLLEIAQHLSGQRSVTWESGVRRGDGTHQLSYIEEATARTKAGAEIPTTITLRLRPYLASPNTIDLTCDVRYRISDGKLQLGYWFVDLDLALEDLFGQFEHELTATTGCRVYAGTAPDKA